MHQSFWWKAYEGRGCRYEGPHINWLAWEQKTYEGREKMKIWGTSYRWAGLEERDSERLTQGSCSLLLKWEYVEKKTLQECKTALESHFWHMIMVKVIVDVVVVLIVVSGQWSWCLHVMQLILSSLCPKMWEVCTYLPLRKLTSSSFWLPSKAYIATLKPWLANASKGGVAHVVLGLTPASLVIIIMMMVIITVIIIMIINMVMASCCGIIRNGNIFFFKLLGSPMLGGCTLLVRWRVFFWQMLFVFLIFFFQWWWWWWQQFWFWGWPGSNPDQNNPRGRGLHNGHRHNL